MGSRRAPRARYEVSALIHFCLPGNSPSAHMQAKGPASAPHVLRKVWLCSSCLGVQNGTDVPVTTGFFLFFVF